MRTKMLFIMPCLLAALLLDGAGALHGAEKWYYAVKINDVVCGYAALDTTHQVLDGAETIVLEHRLFLMLSALGSEFNSEVELTYHIDPETSQFTYLSTHVKQGMTELSSTARRDGNVMRVTSSLSPKEKTVELPPETILDNTLFQPYLLRDFVDAGLEEKVYEFYEPRSETVQKKRCTKFGTETMKLRGEKWDAVVLDELHLETGIKMRLWIDTKTGLVLKTQPQNNRMSYLADESVVKQIEVADLNESIAKKTNVSIADTKGITYMKVEARIEPMGLWVTPEGLNVPGQRFEGTVDENLVEGIFEIEHARYGGTGAPPFPPDFGGIDSVRKFVEPEDLIESDDPVLVAKAEEITAGSKDSWEAAVRLSGWVSDNIAYAIPGGASARDTYDKMAGECGAHSILLAAFCRAVGIPSRVVWGCMYIPNFGGAFGQHGWTEIYMGAAGWIPVDATALEIDYVDSGHIRVGAFQSPIVSLNPIEMKVLDYRVGTGEAGDEASDERYAPYAGEYTGPRGAVFKVFVQDNCLTVDIPDQIKLALSDPDEDGYWFAKLTNRVYIEFEENEDGDIGTMILHEIVPLTRKADPDTMPDGVPEDLQGYLGTYVLAAMQAEFTVHYRDGGLAVYNPLDKRTVGLGPPDGRGRRPDEYGKNEFFFETDEDGGVVMMKIDSINRFERK